MTDHAIDLVLKMKASGLHVGALQRIFTGMQLMCGNKEMLPDLIDMAHEEIAVMLGLAWMPCGYMVVMKVAGFIRIEILNRIVA